MKEKIYTVLIILFSVICGIMSKDGLLGILIILSGFLNAYYASIGKACNYFWGALYSVLSGCVSYLNGLYGISALSFLLYLPSQLQGYLSWKNKKNENNEVEVRGFTFKNSIIITSSCVIGSLGFGMLLSKIPGEQLAFLDASSNSINICGIVLMNLRFKESWIVFLFNNAIDLIIWITNTIKNTPNAIAMLIVSIGYMVINIYGLIRWMKNAKNVEEEKVNEN